MSLSSRLASAPNEAYWALSTADAKFPTITLSTGEEVTVSYGQYRAILATRREQADREKAFRALYGTYNASVNTYATLYNGVCQRDWFQARARGYKSTLEAALHGDNIPTSVVENLIETTRAGVEPLRRYHRLRRRIARRPDLPGLRLLDPARHVRQEVRLRRGARLDRRRRSRRSGPSTRRGCARASRAAGSTSTRTKASAAAPTRRRCTARIPYMLLNYTDTLDDVFTLAHEMGHSMHTILSHETQPFVYSSYTIFVAEVPSTLSEALLLDYMLERSTDPAERIVLLQHAIDNITSTFYTQVMFADFELRAHRLAEQDKPITSEILTEIYTTLLKDYYGDAVDLNDLTGVTWARIPHFFNSPYYVYQYATCFASAAKLVERDHVGRRAAQRAQRASATYAAALRRQRPPDGAAEESGRRSQRARHRPRGHRAARYAGDAAGSGARGADAS